MDVTIQPNLLAKMDIAFPRATDVMISMTAQMNPVIPTTLVMKRIAVSSDVYLYNQ